MAFMEKQVTRKIRWIQIDGDQGITFLPADEYIGDVDLMVGESTDDESMLDQFVDFYAGSEIHTIGVIEGFGARLSASGYLDCTEWSVFETEQEAEESLESDDDPRNDPTDPANTYEA